MDWTKTEKFQVQFYVHYKLYWTRHSTLLPQFLICQPVMFTCLLSCHLISLIIFAARIIYSKLKSVSLS